MKDSRSYRVPLTARVRLWAGKHPCRRRNTITKWAPALIAVVCVSLAITRVLTTNDPASSPSSTISATSTTSSVTSQRSTSALQAVEQRFGPWSIRTDAKAPSNRIVVLYNSGEVRISTKTVEFSPSAWTSSTPFYLRDLTITRGVVNLVASNGQEFTVQIEQPFVLEEYPEKVYRVTWDQVVWSTDAETAQATA